MKPLFNQVSILGLGLIGGSLALDLKMKGLARRVVAYNRSSKRCKIAIKKGACHAAFTNPITAVRDSDLIVFATPVGTIPAIARKVAPHLKAGAVLTDVGSTKAVLVKKLDAIFGSETPFVGSHPIAGTEHSGVESAVSGLFQDRWWLFTPTRKTASHQKALRQLKSLVKSLGAKTAEMTPKDHDRYLALVSHLPHMLAYGLVETVRKTDGGKALRYSGSSFGDFTRIAASSPQMWAEICLDNRETLGSMMDQFEKTLAKIRRAVGKGDAKTLTRLFSDASRVRRKL